MLKKWTTYLLCAWLINALVCFHPTNPFENHDFGDECSISECFNDDTLLAFLISYPGKCKKEDQEQHKINVRSRYTSGNEFHFIANLPVAEVFACANFVQHIRINNLSFFLHRTFSLAQYQHLFRLSPF
ncbi:hypothetical protein FPZ42_13025 [Mucilaginibacter achroorhodeus]|uniref:Uncharacterized protein n=1 Tax=Mucilaginibacter achroorhodeus TaxID=2599294 RepID=A0A563U1M3_9SPHI|nr:hypothetical protein [Mucilaginibacter achroorhodeus]TWR25514.1 hypothetical protein FPZ42_13025 [Mucilaginibacter achroorhodeus]